MRLRSKGCGYDTGELTDVGLKANLVERAVFNVGCFFMLSEQHWMKL